MLEVLVWIKESLFGVSKKKQNEWAEIFDFMLNDLKDSNEQHNVTNGKLQDDAVTSAPIDPQKAWNVLFGHKAYWASRTSDEKGDSFENRIK